MQYFSVDQRNQYLDASKLNSFINLALYLQYINYVAHKSFCLLLLKYWNALLVQHEATKLCSADP
jgi:hypothetical protein